MPQTVIGLAIDVSGSMQESFGSGAEQRLEAVWRSLRSAADEAGTMRSRDDEPLLFAYLFGLRVGKVADLAAVSSLAPLHPKAVAWAHDLGDWYTEAAKSLQPAELLLLASALERRSHCGRELRELLPRKPSGAGWLVAPGDSFRVGVAVATGRTDRALHFAQTIVREEADWLLHRAEKTLPLSEVSRLLPGGALDNPALREFVFGETPMVRALTMAAERFRRFGDARRRLVVISDGEPTDGDPVPVAEELRAGGVAIISCFMAGAATSERAAVMTRIASPAREAPEVASAFRRSGWTGDDDARLVLQVDLTRQLDELFTAALTTEKAAHG